MKVRLAVAVAFVSLSLACPKEAPPVLVDAGVALAVPMGNEVVVFTGAPGWQGGRGCTDVRPEDNCDSQWLHTSGQLVRVFVVTVKDPAALHSFVDKLAADVTTKGGVVDRFTQNGLTLVRFLQAVRGDAIDGGTADDVVTVNYALVGRDQKAVHLITSVVTFDEQQAADAKVRELLGFASWTAK
jgi:hypothetical protein